MICFVATLETHNFQFTACGTTAGKATEALRRGVKRHAKQYGLSQARMWSEWEDSVHCFGIPRGGCARDGGEV